MAAGDDTADEQGDSEDREDEPARPAHRGPYPDVLHRQLLTPTAPLSPGAAMRVHPLPPPPTTTPATWAPDPTGRHQWRWWNGIAWTDDVADDGEAGTDPLNRS